MTLILPPRIEITRIVISILLLVLHVRPSIQLSLTEGQDAVLTFPYPCDSTEVILQHGYKTPFYRLTSPKNQGQRLRVENRISDGNCFLDLMIGSVIRSDEGTYISSVYKDGEILIDETHRIWLGVDKGDYMYPPGKATCVELEGGSRGGDWFELDCLANVGNQPGKIECYQNSEMMPSKTNPVETRTKLTQIMLARSTKPVFCCSSTLNEYKGRCDCNDTALYLSSDSFNDPCPIASTSPTMTYIDRIENTHVVNISNMTYMCNIPTKIIQGNCKVNAGTSRYAISVCVLASISILMSITCTITTCTRKTQTKNDDPKNSIPLLEYNSSERENGLTRGNRHSI